MGVSRRSDGPETVAAALRFPGIDPVDARVLLQAVLGMSHAALLAHAERPLDAAERQRFLALAARRRGGEPVAYVLGWREFYGRRFAVGPAVLIPRPETELLVELALEHLPRARTACVLDLGTGSGNVAITLALERPEIRVSAVDASAEALGLARENAKALGAATVEFLPGDWYGAVAGRRFEVIVSNPPYVADTDPHLGRGDVAFEPRCALRAGADGLDAIRQVIAGARVHLNAGGWLGFEHGFDQAQACRRLLADSGFAAVATACDLAELPRVTHGRKPR
jgi:release factor glutamine methyltransferase